MRPFRFSTRTLMLAVAIAAVEWLILMQSARIGPGIEFTLFMGAVLVMLDILYAGYLASADLVNSAPPEEQAGAMFRLGCFVFLIMVFLIPVVLVVLIAARA